MQIDFAKHPVLLEALPILNRLEEAGHSAYFVGGAVRDVLLGRSIQDVDIATSAMPEQTMLLFRRTFATGLQHGTVTVVEHQINYEITTFRTETTYVEHRRPEQVAFVKELRLDLARRDFTMNAMAINSSGLVVDYFDGMKHLEEGRLVAVGEAAKRFSEDALRMIRAIRFAVTYNLSCDEQLWHAIKNEAPLLKHVSMERVQQEIFKLLKQRPTLDALQLFVDSEILLYTKRPLMLHHVLETFFTSALNVVDTERQMNQEWLWSLIYGFSTYTIEEIRRDLASLVFPKRMTVEIIKYIEWIRFWQYMNVNYSLNSELDGHNNEVIIEALRDTLISTYLTYYNDLVQAKLIEVEAGMKLSTVSAIYWFEQSMHSTQGRHYFTNKITTACQWTETKLKCKEIENQQVIVKLTQLKITGKQLSDILQREPGSWLSTLLHLLYAAVNLGLVKNEKQSLIEVVLKINNSGVLI